jgi:hypothetical protein
MGLSYRYIHKCLYGGDDISVRTVDETIPPIMGTAIRCMTSEPVPVLQRIGNGPAMIAATVIIFVRTRSTAPSIIARSRSRG